MKYSTLEDLRKIELLSENNLSNVQKAIDDNLRKGLITCELYDKATLQVLNLLEKGGKTAVIGEVRIWHGDKFVKVNKDKWEKVNENKDKSDISSEEKQSIKNYCGEGYRVNRKILRGESLSDEDKNKINTINNALSKLANHEGVVFRGLRVDEEKLDNVFNEYFNNKKQIIEYEAFTSTTKDKSILGKIFNANVVMEIKSKTGKSIEHISDLTSEREVLFSTNSRFKINDVKKKVKGGKIIEVNISLIEY